MTPPFRVRLALAGALLALLPTAALAGPEAAPPDDAPHLGDDPSALLERLFSSPDPEDVALPDSAAALSLAEPAPFQTVGGFPRWSVGGALGVLGAKGADRVSIFGEFEARYWLFDALAVKVDTAPYRATFQHGAIGTRQIPVQLSALLTPFPLSELSPYLIAGGGWYYTSADYRNTLASVFPNSHSGKIGGHGGAGLEWVHSSASITIEGAYVVVDPKLNGMKSTDFDHWQLLIGLTLRF
ncbi:MAG TPA: hypothetical protein VKW04_09180 [Planctomycetota bacterium]|nr:hypothetical protein [Planctomycetota bacterium]